MSTEPVRLPAPSPVMEAMDGSDTYFYIHTLAIDQNRRLRLLEPERIEVRGLQVGNTPRTAYG